MAKGSFVEYGNDQYATLCPIDSRVSAHQATVLLNRMPLAPAIQSCLELSAYMGNHSVRSMIDVGYKLVALMFTPSPAALQLKT